MTPALRWAAMRAISCFIIVRDRITRQYPLTTTFEEKGEPKQIRTEVLQFLGRRTAYVTVVNFEG